MRVFSGIQPSGDPTFGNYSGGFRQYAATQEEGESFFCIVDLHAITVDYDAAVLYPRTLDLFSMLLATGLDPDRSTIFAQSHVTAHAEASWLLSAVTSYGQLGRMTQFKEKSGKQEFISAALFSYPVLMAGDILLYRADRVPIGDDQRQHLELSRDIAERFNARFGELFGVPEGIYSVATGESPGEIESRYDGSGYGQFKTDVAEAVVALLEPIQRRYHELRADEPELGRLLAHGAEKARAVSGPVLAEMYERMGFVRP